MGSRPNQQNPMIVLRDVFESKGAIERIAAVCPKHVDPQRVIRMALSSVAQADDYLRRKLLECDPNTLLVETIAAASLGLEFGKHLGEAYLVPFGQSATMIVGYRGLVKLARQSGDVTIVAARIRRERDHFLMRFGAPADTIEHEPCLDTDPGDMIGVWAKAVFRDGSYDVEYMSKAEVERIRERSKAKDKGPWVTDYDEMAKKTVVRRLMKRMPLSPELTERMGDVDRDNEPPVDVTPTRSESKKLADAISSRRQLPTGDEPLPRDIPDAAPDAQEDTAADDWEDHKRGK